MTWEPRHSSVTGPTIVTRHWPDLTTLPQPVFHVDELAILKAAKATPQRYADVALAKRLFRGAWVTRAFPARKPRRKLAKPKLIARGVVEFIPEADD